MFNVLSCFMKTTKHWKTWKKYISKSFWSSTCIAFRGASSLFPIYKYIYICASLYVNIYIQIYIYIWWLIKIPLSANDHSSRIQMLLSRNCRELHVYLSRGQCWATTPLMKIRSPPAKLRQRITDHFLIAFLIMQLASGNPFSGQIVADWFFCKV